MTIQEESSGLPALFAGLGSYLYDNDVCDVVDRKHELWRGFVYEMVQLE
jgi:hypothetical protein